jgi:hypothetical protein
MSYYEGYQESRLKVLQQTIEEDLLLIDSLFGRENLIYGMTDVEVKQEALRQHEIEWRCKENNNAG